MKRLMKANLKRLRPGDLVAVRPLTDIALTLDLRGTLDGLPFVPEMLKYCGQTFTVRRSVDMLILEGIEVGMRRIKNVVLLNGTVCDGSAHKECQRSCFPLWKTAWLERSGSPEPKQPDGARGSASQGCRSEYEPVVFLTPTVATQIEREAPLLSLQGGKGCQMTGKLMRPRTRSPPGIPSALYGALGLGHRSPPNTPHISWTVSIGKPFGG